MSFIHPVHALEQAKASGHIDNPEDLIASIAEKVQQRQNMRLQNQQNSKNNPKLQVVLHIYIECYIHSLSFVNTGIVHKYLGNIV